MITGNGEGKQTASHKTPEEMHLLSGHTPIPRIPQAFRPAVSLHIVPPAATKKCVTNEIANPFLLSPQSSFFGMDEQYTEAFVAWS